MTRQLKKTLLLQYMKIRLTLFFVFVATLIVGIGIGRSIPDSKDDAPAISTTSPTTSVPATQPTAALPHQPSNAASPSATDFSERIKSAITEPNSDRSYVLISAISLDITAENAPAVLDQIDSIPDIDRRSMFQTAILSEWARVAPAPALAYAEARPTNSDRRSALFAVLGGWADVDPAGALEWADRQSDRQFTDIIRTTAFAALAHSDVDSAFEKYQSQSPQLQEQFVYSLFTALAEKSPEAAAARATALPPGSARSTAVQIVADRWSTSDPSAALAWAGALPADSSKTALLANIFGNWGRLDSSAATTSLEQMPPGIVRDSLLSGVILTLVEDDPTEAVRVATLIENEQEQGAAFQNIASAWGSSDPDAVMEWARSQSDPAARDSIWSGIVSAMAESDPSAAARLATNISDAAARHQALSNVGFNWARFDPDGAVAWAAALPDPADRTETVGNVMSVWTQYDPTAALQWFTAEPVSANRDSMIEQFIYSVGATDSRVALDLAMTMSQPEQRSAQVSQLASDWLRHDQPSAEQWLATASIDPQLRDQILSQTQDQSQ